jgi:uncharacterized membrane protein
MTRYIQQVFFKGLIAVIPVVVTIYLIVWLALGFEALFGAVIEYLLPAGAYVPGMGIAVAVLLIFGVGLMLQMWFTRRLWEWGELLLDKMPLVRLVFSALKEVMTYVGGGAGQASGSRVVMVSIGDPPMRMLGLVTRERFELAGAGEQDDTVAVFLPLSYQIGGFTVFVPRAAIVRVDLTPQEALRLAMTAGVTTSQPQASKH